MNALMNSTRTVAGASPRDPMLWALERRERICTAVEADATADDAELTERMLIGDFPVAESELSSVSGAIAALKVARDEGECKLDRFFLAIINKVIATLEAGGAQ